MKKFVTFLVSASVLGLMLASPSIAASNTFPGKNGKIAVLKNGVIGYLSADGKFRKLRFTGNTGYVNSTSFAPDGKRIVFSQWTSDGTDRYLKVQADNGRVKKLDINEMTASYPSFLGNGKIVFSGSTLHPNAEKEGTYLINPDGSGRSKLFDRDQLAASPDGRHFVATNKRGNYFNLYLLNKRGQVVRSLAGDPSKKKQFVNPTFSPNGQLIAYERQLPTGKQSRIFVVSRNGTDRRILTSLKGEQPAFSPDGRSIVFRRPVAGTRNFNGNIATVSIRTGKVRMLSNGRRNRYSTPIWGAR